MRKLKYLFMVIISVTMFTSCFDDATDLDLNDKGLNVVGFESASQNFAAIADGSEYLFTLQIKLAGPTSLDVDGDLTVTFAEAEGTTATEGTHYRIEDASVTLSKSNNYLGEVDITMITDGIVTPLAELPMLYLVTNVTGHDNVVGTGKPIEITLSYACPSNLAGTYDVETIYTAYDGTVSTLTWTEDITETGVGEYRTGLVGHWSAAALGHTPGYTFYDLCDVITIPEQYLADYWANIVAGELDPHGEVKEDGTIITNYSICYGGNCRHYVSTYTPAK